MPDHGGVGRSRMQVERHLVFVRLTTPENAVVWIADANGTVVVLHAVIQEATRASAGHRGRLRFVNAADSPRALGLTFDRAAEEYEVARPAYPPRLVDRAVERAALDGSSRVLEVGCGTGKLTRILVDRGLRVEALDPGANLIDIARRRLEETGIATFHIGRFEDVDLPTDEFDALFSATAFHWVDPAVGWRKAAEVLKAEGVLALLSYVSVRDELSGAAQDKFASLLRQQAPNIDWQPFLEPGVLIAGAKERSANVSEVWEWVLQGGVRRPPLVRAEAAALFSAVEVDYETHVVEQGAQEWARLFRTTALCHALDPDCRDVVEREAKRMIEDRGGTARSPMAEVMVTAIRSPNGRV